MSATRVPARSSNQEGSVLTGFRGSCEAVLDVREERRTPPVDAGFWTSMIRSDPKWREREETVAALAEGGCDTRDRMVVDPLGS